MLRPPRRRRRLPRCVDRPLCDIGHSPLIAISRSRLLSFVVHADSAQNAQGSQLEKLHYLLQQSSIYSKIIAEKMGRERQSRAAAEDKAEKRAAPKAAAAPTSRKTRRGGADTVADEAKPEASTSQPAVDATDAKPKAAAGSRRKAATAPKTEAIADVMDEAVRTSLSERC